MYLFQNRVFAFSVTIYTSYTCTQPLMPLDSKALQDVLLSICLSLCVCAKPMVPYFHPLTKGAGDFLNLTNDARERKETRILWSDQQI